MQQMIGASWLTAGVAGDHADVLGSEDVAQGEELLRDQGLDRGRVVAALPAGHGLEVRGDCHQGLSGPGGGGQDDVVAGGQLHDGLVLGRVERHAAGFDPLGEPGVDVVGI